MIKNEAKAPTGAEAITTAKAVKLAPTPNPQNRQTAPPATNRPRDAAPQFQEAARYRNVAGKAKSPDPLRAGAPV